MVKCKTCSAYFIEEEMCPRCGGETEIPGLTNKNLKRMVERIQEVIKRGETAYLLRILSSDC